MTAIEKLTAYAAQVEKHYRPMHDRVMRDNKFRAEMAAKRGGASIRDAFTQCMIEAKRLANAEAA